MTTSTILPAEAAIGPSVASGAAFTGGHVGHIDASAGGIGVGGTGLLALTGAGPGTLVLALAGLVSVIVGGIAVLTGHRLRTTSDDASPLLDLSSRVGELG